MPHYLRSLLCALAEARYLKRFAFYVDVDHLQSELRIVEHTRFWVDWDRWGAQGQLGVHLIEDTRFAPIKVSKARDTLVVRKFGDVEPGNYWYRVCEEGELLAPPRRAMWWAPGLMRIVHAITSSLQADFDSVNDGGNGDEDLGRGEGIDVEALKAKYSGNVHYLELPGGLGEGERVVLGDEEVQRWGSVEFDEYMRELVDREVFLRLV